MGKKYKKLSWEGIYRDRERKKETKNERDKAETNQYKKIEGW